METRNRKEPEPQPHGVRGKVAVNRKKIEQEQKTRSVPEARVRTEG